MTQKIASIVLLLSAALSAWLYWGSDLKIERLLISREWQSQMVTLLVNSDKLAGEVPVKRVNIISSVKYLPNKTYIRNSVLRLFSADAKAPESTINISETGTWELSDDYLLISPKKFRDVSSNQSKEFTPKQLNLVTKFFKLDAQQSRRIDIINKHAILLTSLNHDSTVLYSY